MEAAPSSITVNLMDEPELIKADGLLDSPARTRPPERAPLRVAAVQERWRPDPEEHRAALSRGVRMGAEAGAKLVCLQELTLHRYFAVDPAGPDASGIDPEPLPGGPTHEFAAGLATELGIHVHASLYERASDGGLGFNTAIVVGPDGSVVSRTRKLHIPVTAGYYEDHYFRPGPADDAPFPVSEIGDGRFGFPTCWDQWFPELARAYSLEDADALVYPTAIGSEPDHPDFDTQPLWEQVIVANGIANAVFMIAVNRIGEEPPLTFYGSSFISDPYGRKLVSAPRDKAAVIVADLDLDQRRDWLELFPFITTRRPDVYSSLTALPIASVRTSGP
jgi:N-carbamoylputrescine amidase